MSSCSTAGSSSRISRMLKPFAIKGISKLRVLGVVVVIFAFLGVLLVGAIVGALVNLTPDIPSLNPNQELTYQKEKYLDVIKGYELLANLYDRQGQNVAEIFDRNNISNNPELVNSKLNEIDQLRDLILINLGSIYELRKAAGLGEANLEN